MKLERLQPSKSVPVSEQMKAWSLALVSELKDWPQVKQKSFFGFTALYRGNAMFGLLPRTRSIFKGNVVAFRMKTPDRSVRALLDKDPRVSAFDKDRALWFTFELSCDADLHDALDYLGRAFEGADIRKKNR